MNMKQYLICKLYAQNFEEINNYLRYASIALSCRICFSIISLCLKSCRDCGFGINFFLSFSKSTFLGLYSDFLLEMVDCLVLDFFSLMFSIDDSSSSDSTMKSSRHSSWEDLLRFCKIFLFCPIYSPKANSRWHNKKGAISLLDNAPN